jgi:hypothetical protein
MLIRIILSRVVAVFLIIATTVTATAQQAPTSLSKRALAIKHKVDSLAPHSPISVILVQGEEKYGDFLANDQEGFTFHDIDRKADITLKYSDVRKVKNGYGGYNSARGKHTDRRKALVITAVVLGGIGALIGAAAAAKN